MLMIAFHSRGAQRGLKESRKTGVLTSRTTRRNGCLLLG